MAKKIKLTGRIAVEFNQRAEGEESPYWVGAIWDISGPRPAIIGDFRNGGVGGPTSVRFADGHDRDAFVGMGEAAFSDLGVEPVEPEAAAIGWAEIIGYGLKCDPGDFTLQGWIDLSWGDSKYSPRTAEQKRRANNAAAAKATRIEQVAAAKRAVSRGQTIVKVGDQYYTFKTRDEVAIRRTAAKRFAGQEIEILA